MHLHKPQRAGFTLIELSVTLVIIGLIVGAIISGTNLIRAGQIRQQVTQIMQFDTAVALFASKYHCLPGDCANASWLGFGTVSTDWGNPANGNGNGIVSCSATPGSSCGGIAPDSLGENYNFWYHLFQAGFIPAYTCTSSANCPGTNGQGMLGLMTPQPKLTYRPVSASGYAAGGIGIAWAGNYNPSTVSAMQVNATHVYVFGIYISGVEGSPFRPSDVSALDRKIDDGLPASGKVISYYLNFSGGWIFTNVHGGWTNDVCTDNSDKPDAGIPPTKYMLDDNFECVGFIVLAGF